MMKLGPIFKDFNLDFPYSEGLQDINKKKHKMKQRKSYEEFFHYKEVYFKTIDWKLRTPPAYIRKVGGISEKSDWFWFGSDSGGEYMIRLSRYWGPGCGSNNWFLDEKDMVYRSEKPVFGKAYLNNFMDKRTS